MLATISILLPDQADQTLTEWEHSFLRLRYGSMVGPMVLNWSIIMIRKQLEPDLEISSQRLGHHR